MSGPISRLTSKIEKGTLCVLFVFLILFGRQSLAQMACDEPAGHTERNSYFAAQIQTQMVYTIYLPPCYDNSAAFYPVLYLMHGSNEDDNQWMRLGLVDELDTRITSGDMSPIIVVFPFGNWIANENRFGANSWGSTFLNQLMPLVESTYRIDANRESRAIGGISRGGFWAYHLAFRNPALFGAVGGHSAFFDQYHADAEYNPLDLALSAPGIEALRIWLDHGADDFAAPGLTLMNENLTRRGVDYTYQVFLEGQHNNVYWSQHVGDYLDFYIAEWPLVENQTVDPTQREPTVGETHGQYILFPVVAFPSLETGVGVAQLEAIRFGLLDTNLVLAEDVADQLTHFELAPGTRIVPTETLRDVLWRERDVYTLLPFDRLTMQERILWVDDVHPLDYSAAFYPFAFEADEPNFFPDRLTRVLMSGVTALTRETHVALDQEGLEWAASGIRDYVTTADYFHTSNEISIYPTCPQTNGPLLGGGNSFCTKPEHFDLLLDIDLDIVELSGNHNNDYGYKAYKETLIWYHENDINTIGGGLTLEEARRPLSFTHNDNQIAMLACNWVGPYYALVDESEIALGGPRPGAAFCDMEWLQEVLPQLAAAHDIVVVSVQYWEFDQYQPTPQQRVDFQMLADLGADVVIGTHAHFPQIYEFYRTDRNTKAFIHYGLGNLFFDQQFFAGRRFFMDQLMLYEGHLLTVDVFPGVIEGQARPRRMDVEEQRNFLFLMFIQEGGF